MTLNRLVWIVILIVVAFGVSAEEMALVRIDRESLDDRNRLLKADVPVVAEFNDALLAFGSPDAMAGIRGYTASTIEPAEFGSAFAVAGLIHDDREADLSACGAVIARGADWFLLQSDTFDRPECRETVSFMLRPLSMAVLEPTDPPPERYADLQRGEFLERTVDPLIANMVADMTDAVVMGHWLDIVNSATTRNSYSQGCQDAVEDVFGLFTALELNPEYQTYNGSFPPNVIGTLPGLVSPDEVVIVIGHLDDMPSSGSAPGADDNASGSAMVTAVAEAMSCYNFERTVKFITVTGEEQGLYGSSGYADQASQDGEDIIAVLNGDMIGFEGDDIPASGEDLDVNTNSASVWLGNLMTQVAAEYDVGIGVNAFSCPSMTYSDHAPFWNYSWSAICGITDNLGFCGEGGNYPYYHTSNDTIANCGPGAEAFEGGAARVYLATAADLATPISAKTDPAVDLTATPNGDHRIDLGWTSGGAGYVHDIYRSLGGCAGGATPELLASVSGESYADTTASGQITYGYWLRSVDGLCTSASTECVEATTTGSCTEPPAFGGVESVTNAASATCQLELDWSPATEIYCGVSAQYNVYRSLDPEFIPAPENLVAEHLNQTTFLDDELLISGEEYAYIVRAVDTSNGMEDGNLVRRFGVPTGPLVMGTWTDGAGDGGAAQLTPDGPWSIRTDSAHGGSNAYGTGDYGNGTCAAVTTPPLYLNPGAQLSFWSAYQIEENWDKGVVQISADQGTTWEKVSVNYPDTVSRTGDACGLPTGGYFSNDSLVDWAQYSGSLDAWSGQEVLIRWLLSSDGAVTRDGWWVDDISITNVGVPGDCTSDGGEIFSDGFETGDTAAW